MDVDPYDLSVAELVPALADALDQVHRDDTGEPSPQVLRPPATEEALAALARRRFGGQLPPSYEAFLRLHDGWQHYLGEVHILGCEDHAQFWVRERLDALRQLVANDDEDDVFIPADAIPVLLGRGGRTFAWFAPSPRHDNGELDILQHDLEFGDLDQHSSFLGFLAEELSLALD